MACLLCCESVIGGMTWSVLWGCVVVEVCCRGAVWGCVEVGEPCSPKRCLRSLVSVVGSPGEPTTRPEKAAVAHCTCLHPHFPSSHIPGLKVLSETLGLHVLELHWLDKPGKPLSASPSHTCLCVAGSRWYRQLTPNTASAQLFIVLAAQPTLPGNLLNAALVAEGCTLGFLLWEWGPAWGATVLSPSTAASLKDLTAHSCSRPHPCPSLQPICLPQEPSLGSTLWEWQMLESSGMWVRHFVLVWTVYLISTPIFTMQDFQTYCKLERILK